MPYVHLIANGVNDEIQLAAALASGTDLYLEGDFLLNTRWDINTRANISIQPWGSTAKLRCNFTTDRMVVVKNSTNININHLEIVNADGVDNHNSLVWFQYAYFDGVNWNKITDCSIHDCWAGIYVYGKYTVPYIKGSHILIQNNELYNYGYCAIQAYDYTEFVSILGNRIHHGNPPGGAVLLYAISTSVQGANLAGASCDDLVIQDNLIYEHPLHNAIDDHGGNRHLIKRNNIFNTASYAIYCHNNIAGGDPGGNNVGWTVDENEIDGAVLGMALTSENAGKVVTGVKARGNLIRNCSQNGIYLGVTNAVGAGMDNVMVQQNSIQSTLSNIYAATGALSNPLVVAESNNISNGGTQFQVAGNSRFLHGKSYKHLV